MNARVKYNVWLALALCALLPRSLAAAPAENSALWGRNGEKWSRKAASPISPSPAIIAAKPRSRLSRPA